MMMTNNDRPQSVLVNIIYIQEKKLMKREMKRNEKILLYFSKSARPRSCRSEKERAFWRKKDRDGSNLKIANLGRGNHKNICIKTANHLPASLKFGESYVF